MLNVITGFLGILMLMLFAWLFSNNRRVINWRVIGWGVSLQILFALFIFVVPAGTKIFLVINDIVLKVLDCAMAGTKFVFGRLALGPGITDESGQTSLGFIMAFQAFPSIVFFAALVGVLYYFGVMQFVIKLFAYVFTKLMRISGAESLCAASEIFVGIESAVAIRPLIKKMTRSELCTILTAGMATVSSSMFAVYIMLLKDKFPTIAGHLVSASILSAPAAIIMSKILCPETGQPETLGTTIKPFYEKENNPFEAIINGANVGVKLVVGIVALLLAFLGIVALIDQILLFFGHPVNNLFGMNVDWTLKGLVGYLTYPFTLIMGVPISEALPIAKIIGSRTIVTEVTAFQSFSTLLNSGAVVSPRTIIITTYALTGFAHVASLAIFVGGVGALAPERLKDLSQLGLRALLAATLACFMTATIAGIFCQGGSILFG
ncbi:MAG: nucleoside transporter C-terminal domain-containing protein [Candidatus Marinimicrobia bacterium]|nr:nucleoside transporter C-terminal domain-containing protein [Candidatus Neomarinimicrobiota bacterium]